MSKVLSRVKSPVVLGGIGSLILTIALFFAEGGFANMNPLYIVGLAVGGGLIVYGLIKEASKEKLQVTEVITKENLTAILEKLKGRGRLEDISPVEADLILAMSIELESTHGYNDITGLLADRASDVPLNELKARPCSHCGIPRNQRGKHHE